MGHVAVIGLGTFGTAVAETLVKLGHEVVAVDQDPGRVDALRDLATHAVCLDARETEALRAHGLETVDVAVVAVGEAFETAILASVNLKRELGVPKVVARARRKREKPILLAVGVDEVICPEEDAGIRLGHELDNPEIHGWNALSPKFSVAQLDIPRALYHKTVEEAELLEKLELNLVAILRNRQGSPHLLVAGPKTPLEPGDQLFLAGENKNLDRFIEVD